MERNKPSRSEQAPPTKTILAPDGSKIHYPNLPGVGEKHQQPSTTTTHEGREPHGVAATTTASKSPPASESWRDRIASSARSVVERAEVYGHAAVKALVLDDWKALTDAHSTPLQRLVGAADLASWAIPEGKVAEIAGHALVKAAEVASEHIAVEGLEHTAEHVAAAAATSRKWSDLTPAERLAGQKPWQDSKIWNRPLTDAERGGAFKTADDAKAFLGSATVRGGVDHDWHHVVESQAEKQFGAERVHNVENLVAIERDPVHDAISKTFQTKDPDLGLTADGKEQNLRTFLKDKPWERHVAQGESELRARGLDPDKMRAETLERFARRSELHDRLLGHPQKLGSSKIVAPEVRAAMASRDVAAGLHYERDGAPKLLPAGRGVEGTIQRVDGDRIVQHTGRGDTATWSREELAGHFTDPKAFDAMMQPGHYVKVGADRNGIVDVQQRLPDHSWQSLGNQPMAQHSVGDNHSR